MRGASAWCDGQAIVLLHSLFHRSHGLAAQITDHGSSARIGNSQIRTNSIRRRHSHQSTRRRPYFFQPQQMSVNDVITRGLLSVFGCRCRSICSGITRYPDLIWSSDIDARCLADALRPLPSLTHSSRTLSGAAGSTATPNSNCRQQHQQHQQQQNKSLALLLFRGAVPAVPCYRWVFEQSLGPIQRRSGTSLALLLVPALIRDRRAWWILYI